jgi:hypothetical protein
MEKEEESIYEDLLHSYIALVDNTPQTKTKKISYLASQQRVRQRMGGDQEKR